MISKTKSISYFIPNKRITCINNNDSLNFITRSNLKI